MIAATVPDRSITAEKLAPGVIPKTDLTFTAGGEVTQGDLDITVEILGLKPFRPLWIKNLGFSTTILETVEKGFDRNISPAVGGPAFEFSIRKAVENREALRDSVLANWFNLARLKRPEAAGRVVIRFYRYGTTEFITELAFDRCIPSEYGIQTDISVLGGSAIYETITIRVAP